MITIRASNQRGHADHGWLNTYHTFSFANYYDPSQMGFRVLRVINEDRVGPGEGFGTHGHRDMEIITYVIQGGLEHRDSMGNNSVIRPGELQRMSAGRGVTHSEYNASNTEPVHFLQIWLLPERAGGEPSYAQKMFTAEERTNRLAPIATRSGRDGSVAIQQNVELYSAILDEGAQVAHNLPTGRHAYAQVVRGDIELNGIPMSAGDGAAISDETALQLRATTPAEILLFDLP
ncbi:MAG: pirin family protein [Chlorobi bacterium]|nr:pirin family protein [Chlorobiota bacterium]